VKKAENFPPPTLEDVFNYTYASMPEDLKSQLEFQQRDLDRKGE
jgi:hypothetical protein